jgi:hypothetical protein
MMQRPEFGSGRFWQQQEHCQQQSEKELRNNRVTTSSRNADCVRHPHLKP